MQDEKGRKTRKNGNSRQIWAFSRYDWKEKQKIDKIYTKEIKGGDSIEL